MASGPLYQVYNRRQQGFAETTRLILEHTGASYENVFADVRNTPLSPFYSFSSKLACLTNVGRIGNKRRLLHLFNKCPYSKCDKTMANGYTLY